MPIGVMLRWNEEKARAKRSYEAQEVTVMYAQVDLFSERCDSTRSLYDIS